jgi:hypothetical protein
MRQKSILYLDKPGRTCGSACVLAAAQRAASLGLTHAVVATTTGRTALDLALALKKCGARAKVVGVGYAANFAAKWGRLDPRLVGRAEGLGVRFLTGGHAFGGVNTAISSKFGGLSPNKIVAQTYYTMGQGFKVAVEVSLMAADQHRLPAGREVLALGGTGKGADTALVLTPVCSAEFFDLRIHEIVCKPR